MGYSIGKEIKRGEPLLASNCQPTKKNFQVILCEHIHDNCALVVESNVRNAIEMFARKAFGFQIEFYDLMSVYTDENQTKEMAILKLRRISKLKKSSNVVNVSFKFPKFILK